MNLTDILKKTGIENFKKEEILFLLNQKEEDAREEIYRAARKVRQKYFNDQVFFYGFVYFSTYCRNNCSFCFYRKENKQPPRYRKSRQEIIETAVSLKESGVHLIDLTMGEDPYYISHPEELIETVREVKDKTGLPVMISPGVVSHKVIDQLAEAGASWYALYQETHQKKLYDSLRTGQPYEERMAAKEYAAQKGMLIEEGLLTGVGESREDIYLSFQEMERLGASQVRTMTFIPQDGTPMGKIERRSFHDELLNIALMRILFPDRLIPASLDVDGLNGLKQRLMAGANVITSIIPPKKGFAGVASAKTDIDEGGRTVEGIMETVKECGLSDAGALSYQKWIEKRQSQR
ncbi:MAG: methylornithine synthase PylB [Lachnospiraceae bacterium]|nr:methylornithine synthase PylB [Lachnospiraceae bacterium]